jgi:selenocysteine-specific elongation factor
LSDCDIEIKDKLLNKLDSELYETSGLSELAQYLNENENKIKSILKIAEDDLVVINSNIFFTKNNYDKLLDKIGKFFKMKDTLSISEFKDITKSSRKYVVPLLEYLDKNKITYRVGNERKYNKK